MSFCGLINGMSPKSCILCVRVKINKRSFEPFCFLILEDFSGCYCLISFECMFITVVVCVGGGGLVGWLVAWVWIIEL